MARMDFKSQFKDTGKKYADELKKPEKEPVNFTEHVALAVDRDIAEKEDPVPADTDAAADIADNNANNTNGANDDSGAVAADNDADSTSRNAEDTEAKEGKGVSRTKAAGAKQTSLNLDKDVTSYIAINARLEGMTQNEFLASLLYEKTEVIKDIVPDYTAEKSVRQSRTGTAIRSYAIPEDLFKWMTRQSALRQKSHSQFVNDIIREHMEASAAS